MELTKVCNKCGAKWLEGQLYWSTGQPGLEIDLAGLVCNQANSAECINPQKGATGGQTWEKRLQFLEDFETEFESRMAELD